MEILLFFSGLALGIAITVAAYGALWLKKPETEPKLVPIAHLCDCGEPATYACADKYYCILGVTCGHPAS